MATQDKQESSQTADDTPADPVVAVKLEATPEELNSIAERALGVVFTFGAERLRAVEKELEETRKPQEEKDDEDSKSVFGKDTPQRFMELGLGRGVDATEQTPWLSKSSFQVRKIVQVDGNLNLIGTDEGGSLHKYEHEVTSATSQRAKLEASVTIPESPVAVGVDAELARSVTKTQKAYGKRVKTRTISFVSRFEDLQTADDKSGSFETLLSDFVEKSKQNEDPSNKSCYCQRFVEKFHITHYVKSITLGASLYTVESQAEYYSKVSAGGNIGVEAAGKAKASVKFIKKEKSRSEDIRHIGRIGDDDMVTRDDEAVIEVALDPIHYLVQNKELRDCLQAALQRYISSFNRESGPYVVSCNDAQIFWMVIEIAGMAYVYGTRDINKASLFYVFPTEDGKHPYEFLLGWQGTTFKEGLDQLDTNQKCLGKVRTDAEVKRTMRYLNAPVDFTGRNDGPLTLESRVKKNSSRFSLHSPLTELLRDAINPDELSYGEDSFLLECSRRHFGIDGYLGVQTMTGKETWEFKKLRTVFPEAKRKEFDDLADLAHYKTTCIPSPKSHNSRNIWMVLRLLPDKYWKDLSKSANQDQPPPEESHSEAAALDIVEVETK